MLCRNIQAQLGGLASADKLESQLEPLLAAFEAAISNLKGALQEQSLLQPACTLLQALQTNL